MRDHHTDEGSTDDRRDPSGEHVRALGEDRYVVSPNEDEPFGDGPAGVEPEAGAAPLADLDGAYAFEIHARHGDGTDGHRLDTNDVTEAFESLLRWYAGAVAPDVAPAAAVETLLANADLDGDGPADAGRSP